METTNTSGLDYSKISVTDMCYFLNGRADLSQNESLFNGLKPHNIQKSEMYEYIKFKTDNFDKYKFSLFIDDIRWFDIRVDMHYNFEGKEILKEDIFIDDAIIWKKIQWNPEKFKLHEFIYELSKYGYIIHNTSIIRFSELAEDLYKTVCETPGAITGQSQGKKQYQFTNNLTDTQRGKLYDLLVLHKFIPESDKAGFIWAFGGKNDKYTNFKTKWLKAKSLAVYLIDQLCYDITATTHFWAIGTRIFGIENMAQMKENYKSVNKTEKPRGYKTIDNIINEIRA